MKTTSRQGTDEKKPLRCPSISKETVASAASAQSLADILKADGTGSGRGSS